MAALNNIQTTDGYTEAATLHFPPTNSVTVMVYNAGAYAQLRVYDPRLGLWPEASADWRPEEFLPQVTAHYTDKDLAPYRCIAARVRSAVAGIPAQVTILA